LTPCQSSIKTDVQNEKSLLNSSYGKTIQASTEITYEAFKMSFQASDRFVQRKTNVVRLLVKDDFEIDHLLLGGRRALRALVIFGSGRLG